jgi:hypothetical protein
VSVADRLAAVERRLSAVEAKFQPKTTTTPPLTWAKARAVAAARRAEIVALVQQHYHV